MLTNENERTTKNDVNAVGWRYALGCTIVTLLALGASFLLRDFLTDISKEAQSNISLIFTLVINQILLPLILFLLVKGLPTYKLPRVKKSVAWFWVALAIGYGYSIIGSFLGMGVNYVVTGSTNSIVSEILGYGNKWLMIFVTCIGAPVAEELAFRKILVDKLAGYSKALAIFSSGIMFGIFHGNFQQFFFATVLGCVFAYVYVESGNILLTMLMHMIINSISTIMSSFLLPNMDTNPIAMVLIVVISMGIFVMVLGGIGLGIAFCRRIRISYEDQPHGKMSDFFKSWGMYVFIIFGIVYFVYNYMMLMAQGY